MTRPVAIAVTGAGGRVGRALVASLRARGAEVIAWSRPDYDLDDPEAARRLIRRDRPAVVFHAAAWTDVDGCAAQPRLASRRNTAAVEVLAKECLSASAGLLVLSTNEVFDGRREDGRGYSEADRPHPINVYGLTKLAGERVALATYRDSELPLWVVRTAWVYGPPGNDFPARILSAARAASNGGRPVRVVVDEVGSPTYSADLAAVLADLPSVAPRGGLFHLAGAGRASRFELAAAVLERCLPDTPLEPIRQADFARASSPPAWAVLDCSRAATLGIRLRPWAEALEDYLASLCR